MRRKMNLINLVILILSLIFFILSTDSLSSVTNLEEQLRNYFRLISMVLLIIVFTSSLITEFKFKNK